MATLVFTTLGTALGGPLGGALGAILGNSIDRSVLGGPTISGPRLKELTATTSSYGTAIPRHFGRIRTSGSVIWATELVETSERSGGGGKGRPATTTYSYSASFAVALASRPISRLGRIWADGRLLRGAAGDLKVGGTLRVHTGHGDQAADPLIAADKGAACPAFRGMAYCVFENLQLGDFGNRIPVLSFEIIADEGAITLDGAMLPLGDRIEIDRPLAPLRGFSDEGGSLTGLLATLDPLFPIGCDASGDGLAIRAADSLPAVLPTLPEAASIDADDGFAPATGSRRRRLPDAADIPTVLRYYDQQRDYQPGLQRADGRARPGRSRTLELPGSLEASGARALINRAAERAAWAREQLSWRVAELDPAIGPGSVVAVPGHDGAWLITSWEWREQGIELELRRLPRGPAREQTGAAGEAMNAADLATGPTLLEAFELPWDGNGSPDERRVFAALSSTQPGWTGAALFAESPGGLAPIGHAGGGRNVIGHTLTALAPAQALRLDRTAEIEVQLAAADLALDSASPESLATGANRALIGGELLQFVSAHHLGGGRWRLTGLLRGRGGTETLAREAHPAGAPFILIDDTIRALDQVAIGSAVTIAALGLADSAPVIAALVNKGLSLAPLQPVHPRWNLTPEGDLELRWTRRARGAWSWPDNIDAPLHEQAESYRVGIGDPASPLLLWQTGTPHFTLTSTAIASLLPDHAGAPVWVRQIGSHDLSPPLLLTNIA